MNKNRYNSRKNYSGGNAGALLSGLVSLEETVTIEETVTAADGTTRQRRMIKTSKYVPPQLFDTQQKLLKG